MKLASDYLSNSYIVPCDIWCDQNPFSKHELYSWYMVSDLIDNDSSVRINRKMELTTISPSSGGNSMIGISYLLKDEASIVQKRLQELDRKAAPRRKRRHRRYASDNQGKRCGTADV